MGRKAREDREPGPTEKVDKRTPDGRFAPGCLPNPGGRPRMSKEEREAWQALATKCREKIEKLLARDELPPMTLAKFAELALDRAYGKAVQALELGGPEGEPVGFQFVDPPNRSPE